jgi:hypothetical protein
MEAEDARTLVELLVKIHELLRDVAKGPTSALPPGLWQPLADAINDLGDPSSVLVSSERPGERFQVDADGHPLLAPNPTPRGPLPSAVVRIVSRPANEAIDQGMEDHGFTGAPLALKKALVDYGHTAYMAGGRLPEIPKNDEHWLRRAAGQLHDALGPAATVVGSLSKVAGFDFLGAADQTVNGVRHALDFGRRLWTRRPWRRRR